MLIFKNMLLVSWPSHCQSRRRGQQPAVPGWCQKVPREGAAPGEAGCQTGLGVPSHTAFRRGGSDSDVFRMVGTSVQFTAVLGPKARAGFKPVFGSQNPRRP